VLGNFSFLPLAATATSPSPSPPCNSPFSVLAGTRLLPRRQQQAHELLPSAAMASSLPSLLHGRHLSPSSSLRLQLSHCSLTPAAGNPVPPRHLLDANTAGHTEPPWRPSLLPLLLPPAGRPISPPLPFFFLLLTPWPAEDSGVSLGRGPLCSSQGAASPWVRARAASSPTSMARRLCSPSRSALFFHL
jgi:hypothetical protein